MTGDSVPEAHVLIVEDDPDFAALLQSILANAGYTTATAHNCDDALSQAETTRPDLITLDIQLPGKSGAFFYRKLKVQERFRHIPVVVVTGLTHDKEVGNLIRRLLETDDMPHPAAYLEKPIDGPSLLRTIEEAMAINNSVTC